MAGIASFTRSVETEIRIPRYPKSAVLYGAPKIQFFGSREDRSLFPIRKGALHMYGKAGVIFFRPKRHWAISGPYRQIVARGKWSTIYIDPHEIGDIESGIQAEIYDLYGCTWIRPIQEQHILADTHVGSLSVKQLNCRNDRIYNGEDRNNQSEIYDWRPTVFWLAIGALIIIGASTSAHGMHLLLQGRNPLGAFLFFAGILGGTLFVLIFAAVWP